MPPDDDVPEGTDDTTDADAEAFADEWVSYKSKVDSMHSFWDMLMKSEPEKPHWYFRSLFTKKSK